MQEASKLADAIAASEEHMEELKARITARQDWITREQESVDAKIEEATRPVTQQRAQAAQQHSSLQEEVEELRYGVGYSSIACATGDTGHAHVTIAAYSAYTLTTVETWKKQ